MNILFYMFGVLTIPFGLIVMALAMPEGRMRFAAWRWWLARFLLFWAGTPIWDNDRYDKDPDYFDLYWSMQRIRSTMAQIKAKDKAQ